MCPPAHAGVLAEHPQVLFPRLTQFEFSHLQPPLPSGIKPGRHSQIQVLWLSVEPGGQLVVVQMQAPLASCFAGSSHLHCEDRLFHVELVGQLHLQSPAVFKTPPPGQLRSGRQVQEAPFAETILSGLLQEQLQVS
jgi:hypothetical protein